MDAGSEGITWGESWRIRREAIRDARHAQPQPIAGGRVTTPFREAVWTKRDDDIANLARVLETELVAAMAAIASMHQALADLDNRLVDALKKLTEAESEQFDLALRRGGDAKLPAAAVAVRRTRDHAREVQPLQSAHEAIEAEVATLRRELAEREAHVAGLRRVAARHAKLVHFAQLARRDRYDRVLVRKHPKRRLLAGGLDPAVKPLPSWVEDALAAEENLKENPS